MDVKPLVLKGISDEVLSEKSSGQLAPPEGDNQSKSKVLSQCYVTVLTLRRVCDRHPQRSIRSRCR
jgi:hypothetical protein